MFNDHQSCKMTFPETSKNKQYYSIETSAKPQKMNEISLDFGSCS